MDHAVVGVEGGEREVTSWYLHRDVKKTFAHITRRVKRGIMLNIGQKFGG